MIEIAENAGFCFGVKRATDCVERLINESEGTKIFTLGKLIHNTVYIDGLKSMGVFPVEMSEVQKIAERSSADSPAVLVIRAHGITRDDEKRLAELSEQYEHFSFIDMTCPFVKRIHRIAQENTGDDTLFMLLGNKDHPEVCSIMSYAEGESVVLSCAEDLSICAQEKYGKKQVILASQTTQSTAEWKKCQKNSEKLCTNAKVFDTICNVTENRQSEAQALSSRSDVMIVIGGRDSSNTHKLYEICKKNCPKTYWIEKPSEISSHRFSSNDRIGITAGASTPAKLIMEVQNNMNTVEKIDFESMLNESLKTLHTGETVTGIVTAIAADVIYVDLGTKVTGVINRSNITDDTSVSLNTLFKVGDSVDAFVIRVNDREGIAELSKKRVDSEKSWSNIVALKESGEVVDAKILSAVKGGVLVDVNGYKAFMPASQISVNKIEDLNTVVGETKKVIVIDIDNAKKRAVCSAKVIERAEKKALEDKVWQTLELGAHYDGVVKNFIPHGAFVDIGGVDGLIPNSELSWKRIKHPSQILKIGQEVAVYIKELDAENRRITLGYKTEEMDPFYNFKKNYKVGDDVEAKIVSIMPYGAFAEVTDGCDGLIHISKISRDKVEKPEDVLTIGQVVKARITDIDLENRKFNLSMRVYADEEYNKQRAEEKAAAKAERDAQRKAEEEERAKEAAEYAPYIVKSIDA